jgi:hypothetical protein
METAVLTIKFKEEVSSEDAMELISGIFNSNSGLILGMNAKLLDSEETFNEIQSLITETLKNKK